MFIFFRQVHIFVRQLGGEMDKPSKEEFSYPTKFTMPNETYNKQLADVSSSQYKALFKKLEINVSLHVFVINSSK